MRFSPRIWAAWAVASLGTILPFAAFSNTARAEYPSVEKACGDLTHWLAVDPHSVTCMLGEVKDGRYQERYDNGDLRVEGEYVIGQKVCVWKYWKPDRSLEVVRESTALKGCSDSIPAGAVVRNSAPGVPGPTTGSPNATLATAPLPSPPQRGPAKWFDHLEISEMMVAQYSGGNSLSAEVNWSPLFHFGSSGLGIGATVGWALMKAAGGTFNTTEYEGTISFERWGWGLAAQAGAQSWWVTPGGTGFEGSGKLSRNLHLWIVDQVFARYTAFLFPVSDFSNEVTVGLTLRFFN